MAKIAAMEEMYLIYKVIRDYLGGSDSWGDVTLAELTASYRSFCLRWTHSVGQIGGRVKSGPRCSHYCRCWDN
jgi:hypothetical protein